MSDEERLAKVELAVIKLNHFTETFPNLMEVKLKALDDGLKLNRKLIILELGGLVTGVLGLLFVVLQYVQNMP